MSPVQFGSRRVCFLMGVGLKGAFQFLHRFGMFGNGRIDFSALTQFLENVPDCFGAKTFNYVFNDQRGLVVGKLEI